jgi:transposase
LHVDATRFHVHGRYGSGEEGQTVDAGDEPRAIRLTHGYSRDHRPDLQQWVMNPVCADSGGLPLLCAPGDGNQSDRAELVRLVRRYRESLNLGAVVVLDGTGCSQENLRALLEGEFPREAWLPLLPGYRGLAVEADCGGVRQRWLLVEGEERARLAEEELNRRVARAEGEAQKVLGQLTARSFACEADLRGALAEASARLPFHRLVHLGVQERKRGRVGRPPEGEAPLAVGYRLLARLGSWSGRGRA